MTRTNVTGALVAPPVLGALLGALGGWLWWTWWSPAPDGRIYDTPTGPAWYPDPFDPGITGDFGGTATFVVTGFALALVLGLVGAWLAREQAVPGLVAVLLGAGVAVGAMVLVGAAFSPADPATLVADHAVGDRLPGSMQVTGWTPYLAWPVGALAGYLVLLLSLPSRPERPVPPSFAPAPPG